MTEIPFAYGFPTFSLEQSPVNFNKNKILSADIWSFWDYTIKQYSSTQRKRQILSALLEQAKTFYLAAENADIRSRPLLYYYSFLNFGKMGIELHKSFEKSQRFDHGIEVVRDTNMNFHNAKVKIKRLHSEEPSPDKRSSCYEVMKITEPDLSHLTFPLDTNVKELLKHCVGVHRAYSNVYSEKEVFVNLRDIKLYKDGKKLIFMGSLDSDVSDDELAVLESIYGTSLITNEKKLKVEYDRGHYHINRQDYFELSKKVNQLGIWYYIGNSGYSFYLSKKSDYRYTPAFNIYSIMFYLGSITRYHPYLFDDIFSDKDQWVISEFLSTQPKQFLYLYTSHVLGIELLEPKTKF